MLRSECRKTKEKNLIKALVLDLENLKQSEGGGGEEKRKSYSLHKEPNWVRQSSLRAES